MTQTIDRMPVPENGAARRSSAIEVHRLTSFIGAELRNVSLADARERPGRVRRDQGPAPAAQGPVLPRPGHQPRRPRQARRAVRPARGPPRRRQRPGAPGPGPDLQGPGQPGRAVRERVPLRRDLARGPADGFGAALRRGPGRRRRHDLGGHGRRRTSACPSTSRPRSPTCGPGTASSRPSAPTCRSRSASRCTRGSPTRSTRSCGPTPRPARRSCSSTPSRPTSPTSTPPRTSATGTTTAPAAASCSTT